VTSWHQTHLQGRLLGKILDLAGPYAYWMFGAFIACLGLFLIPSNVVVFILRDYSSHGDVPALSILQTYLRAGSIAQTLYMVVIAITVGVQLFFLVITARRSVRYLIGAVPFAVLALGFFGVILLHSGVLGLSSFNEQAAADIRQIEEGRMETATIHINSRQRAEIRNDMGSPLDILVSYDSPLQTIRGIRPGEGLGWESFRVPDALQFESNAQRPYDENRSISQNLEHAQLYHVTFTSNRRLVYSIEWAAP